MQTFLTILATIIIFGIIINIHEAGHFFFAKLFGVRVNEFSFGMGPLLFQRTKGETQYSVRLFPIGGFVAMEGESEDSDDERAFFRKPAWQRFIILCAGAAMNILLGLGILMVLAGGQELLGTTVIADFDEGTPAAQYLQSGDRITSINGCRISGYNDALFQLLRDEDGLVDFQVVRDGEKVTLDQVPFEMETYPDGTRAVKLGITFYGVPTTFLSSVRYAVGWTGSIVKQVWYSFLDILTGRYGLSELSGPVGTATVVSQASSLGLRSVVLLVAFLTINVGVFNLFPIPALDGGRLLFVIIEMIRRRPVDPKYESWIHAAGMALLMSLIIVVTFSDISKLLG